MSKIVIATTTRYSSPDELRCRFAQDMIHLATESKCRVFVIDGSSNKNVVKRLKDVGAHVLKEEQGATMGQTHQAALQNAQRLATAGEVVVWMEPEKMDLVRFLPGLAQVILGGVADIVIPCRTDRSMQSYPYAQQMAERFGNEVYRRLTGLSLDVWFGPRLLSKKALSYFLDYDGTYGDKWDSIFIPLLQAQKDGLRIMGIPIDYVHPAEQTGAEEHDLLLGVEKRLDQLQSLVSALIQETQKLGFEDPFN